MRFLSAVRAAPARMLIAAIRAYQLVISPMTGPTCKYHPSCSRYAITALRRHGAVRGSRLAAWRILRCNPWSKGGVDDVPPPRTCIIKHSDGSADRPNNHPLTQACYAD